MLLRARYKHSRLPQLALFSQAHRSHSLLITHLAGSGYCCSADLRLMHVGFVSHGAGSPLLPAAPASSLSPRKIGFVSHARSCAPATAHTTLVLPEIPHSSHLWLCFARRRQSSPACRLRPPTCLPGRLALFRTVDGRVWSLKLEDSASGLSRLTLETSNLTLPSPWLCFAHWVPFVVTPRGVSSDAARAGLKPAPTVLDSLQTPPAASIGFVSHDGVRAARSRSGWSPHASPG